MYWAKVREVGSTKIVGSGAYVTGFAKRDLFDKFFKIEFSSHLSATRIALNSDQIRVYQIVQLSRKMGSKLP